MALFRWGIDSYLQTSSNWLTQLGINWPRGDCIHEIKSSSPIDNLSDVIELFWVSTYLERYVAFDVPNQVCFSKMHLDKSENMHLSCNICFLSQVSSWYLLLMTQNNYSMKRKLNLLHFESLIFEFYPYMNAGWSWILNTRIASLFIHLFESIRYVSEYEYSPFWHCLIYIVTVMIMFYSMTQSTAFISI